MVEDPLGLTFIGNKQKLIHDLLEVRFLLEPSIAAMAATRANKKDIKKITTLCDDVEALLKKHADHTQKDISSGSLTDRHDISGSKKLHCLADRASSGIQTFGQNRFIRQLVSRLQIFL